MRRAKRLLRSFPSPSLWNIQIVVKFQSQAIVTTRRPLIKLTFIQQSCCNKLNRSSFKRLDFLSYFRWTTDDDNEGDNFTKEYWITRKLQPQCSSCSLWCKQKFAPKVFTFSFFHSNGFLIKTIKWNLCTVDWRHKSPDRQRYKFFLFTSVNRINLHVH